MSVEPDSVRATEVRENAALMFPPGFVWGAATAAFQVEGATTADGRTDSVWDVFARRPGAVRGGDNGEPAADHYRRYSEDVGLMRRLNLGAYRFSLAWPRVRPDGGAPNAAGLAFYDRLVDCLLESGVQPWATLYHWDLPQALEDEGGWAARDTAARFADYAGVVVDALGDRVRHWSTLNEPMCSALLGYHAGQHAPGHRDPARAARAVHHLLLGHGLAARVLRDGGVSSLGLTLNFTPVSPATATPADADAARRVDGQQNRMFLEAAVRGSYPADVVADLEAAGAPLPVADGDLAVIAAPLDWLGVNYYFSALVGRGVTVAGRPSPVIGAGDVVELDPQGPTTTMGWGIDPEAFTALPLRLTDAAPGLPLVVTENGSAWPDEVGRDGQVHDAERTDYLLRHLGAVAVAIDRGADVRGYFAWSFIDNYEWARGYAQRFGLVHVDYATQRRTVKDSGRVYAAVVRRHREV